ncbi:hypothetical protein [Levilactobacillus hammesii]|uniref:hypothetical protein n=1 Tax=Levilactobacillus hammesii TaxID=267633 RepID=UPI00403DB13A
MVAHVSSYRLFVLVDDFALPGNSLGAYCSPTDQSNPASCLNLAHRTEMIPRQAAHLSHYLVGMSDLAMRRLSVINSH